MAKKKEKGLVDFDNPFVFVGCAAMVLATYITIAITAITYFETVYVIPVIFFTFGSSSVIGSILWRRHKRKEAEEKEDE